MSKQDHIPTPSELLELAEQEFSTPNLPDYLPVIEALRNKDFSWRRIASWLSTKGIEATHNEVYYLARTAKRRELMDEIFGDPREAQSMTPVEEALAEMDHEKELEDYPEDFTENRDSGR
ncbi:MAG: hypothetical protein ACQKBV_06845 [Puniceicoccales bacterium]